ncbi:acyl-CoA thioesterase [Euzebya sp.]|uniref:acyl-CoA thioesterase n=1 Tax=Euzebya sp. TaxID=1971409 RepID=UPI003512968D
MGASITLTRRLEWMDTDAAVRWHHATTWRWAELAEAELHRSLGIIDMTFGCTPRRRVEAEFHRAVLFDDEVQIDFAVESVGRTSATYAMEVRVGDEVAATARMVVVLVDDDGRPRPWPDDVADLLRGAGG